MKKLHIKRLRNVPKALRESEHPEEFTMQSYTHRCNTPACALGHYASRRDLQRTFYLKHHNVLSSYGISGFSSPIVLEHFGLTFSESSRLFGSIGCSRAQTTEAAALYFDSFIEEKIHGSR